MQKNNIYYLFIHAPAASDNNLDLVKIQRFSVYTRCPRRILTEYKGDKKRKKKPLFLIRPTFHFIPLHKYNNSCKIWKMLKKSLKGAVRDQSFVWEINWIFVEIKNEKLAR